MKTGGSQFGRELQLQKQLQNASKIEAETRELGLEMPAVCTSHPREDISKERFAPVFQKCSREQRVRIEAKSVLHPFPGSLKARLPA